MLVTNLDKLHKLVSGSMLDLEILTPTDSKRLKQSLLAC